MTLEEAIFGRLTADVGVSALLGTRAYPGQAPQSSTLPVLVYQQASQKKLTTLTGVINLNQYGLRLDLWAADYAGCKALYNAVRDCLVGFRGTLGSGAVDVRGVFEESGDDQAESPIHAEENGLYRAGLDLNIWYGN